MQLKIQANCLKGKTYINLCFLLSIYLLERIPLKMRGGNDTRTLYHPSATHMLITIITPASGYFINSGYSQQTLVLHCEIGDMYRYIKFKRFQHNIGTFCAVIAIRSPLVFS